MRTISLVGNYKCLLGMVSALKVVAKKPILDCFFGNFKPHYRLFKLGTRVRISLGAVGFHLPFLFISFSQ